MITLYLTQVYDQITADDDHPDSTILFSHLFPEGNPVYTKDLPEVETLAKAHEWEMSIRPVRDDELDD